ncbi:hypothetical protein HANVADRAFT_2180 [Hanseniaspora valbyensis NRRL Y-1626]|uniref:Uncharacterized protein n=1 Tax=Hanseniaspora valbyensis NRRL Y-1626 TaxID=766949 RepID=A0A1B7TEA0_9ASCO|nr:hypothetical protein HANVADRAFT_2180 [Hanseniaspora valbyensis NRRL Y-1626]
MNSDENKLELLNSLKKYHDILVKINNMTDLVKEYKIYFNQDSILLNEINQCFEDNEAVGTSIVNNIYFSNNELKINENNYSENKNLDKNENTTLKNRKQKIQKTNDELKPLETKDMTEQETDLFYLLTKQKHVLDYSKSRNRKKLLTNINENYTKLIMNEINELLKIKNDILNK